jgi:mycothiol synthase
MAMVEYLRSRLTVMAGEHPADAPKFFQSWGTKGLKWQEDLMEQLGLKPVRYSFSMIRSCSEPVEVYSLPEGIEVRPVGPEDYRAVFDAEAEAFKDHWGYVAPTDNDFERFLNSSNFDPSLWKVAWDGDQVVGQVLNFVDPKENEAFNRKRGYTEDISVRRPWRRRGVARALLTQSVKMFQDMGFEETSLGVDTENPNGALQLYESVGYKEDRCFINYRAQML